MDSTCPQDVGLPYMTDGRHAPDTLFLVAENDFRFRREDCVSGRNWLQEVDDFVSSHLVSADSVDAWRMLKPGVPPELEPIERTTDTETGGALEEVEPYPVQQGVGRCRRVLVTAGWCQVSNLWFVGYL